MLFSHRFFHCFFIVFFVVKYRIFCAWSARRSFLCQGGKEYDEKSAVCLYTGFCNFEFSAILETLKMDGWELVYIGKTIEPVRCEEGFLAIPERCWKDVNACEYEALLLTGVGAEGDEADWLMVDEDLRQLIRDFDNQKKLIAAISCAPMFLIGAGILQERKVLASVSKEVFMEGGLCTTTAYTQEELANLIDVEDIKHYPDIQGSLQQDNIITSNAWWYREWAAAIAHYLHVPFPYGTFGLSQD